MTIQSRVIMNSSKLFLAVTIFVVVLGTSTHAWQDQVPMHNIMDGMRTESRDGALNNNDFWRSVSDRFDSSLGQDYSSTSKTR